MGIQGDGNLRDLNTWKNRTQKDWDIAKKTVSQSEKKPTGLLRLAGHFKAISMRLYHLKSWIKGTLGTKVAAEIQAGKINAIALKSFGSDTIALTVKTLAQEQREALWDSQKRNTTTSGFQVLVEARKCMTKEEDKLRLDTAVKDYFIDVDKIQDPSQESAIQLAQYIEKCGVGQPQKQLVFTLCEMIKKQTSPKDKTNEILNFLRQTFVLVQDQYLLSLLGEIESRQGQEKGNDEHIQLRYLLQNEIVRRHYNDQGVSRIYLDTIRQLSDLNVILDFTYRSPEDLYPIGSDGQAIPLKNDVVIRNFYTSPDTICSIRLPLFLLPGGDLSGVDLRTLRTELDKATDIRAIAYTINRIYPLLPKDREQEYRYIHECIKKLMSNRFEGHHHKILKQLLVLIEPDKLLKLYKYLDELKNKNSDVSYLSDEITIEILRRFRCNPKIWEQFDLKQKQIFQKVIQVWLTKQGR